MSDHCAQPMRPAPTCGMGGGDALLVVLLCAGVLAVLAGAGAMDMATLSDATSVLFTS
ncbi:hypothetical protein [Gluconacetobacter takamatsuzukensis]|uniref:Uncharacterized protein n=1 Tax=Gluconacetobacter takamatsuzukensis TaxID=1286190 RepID=A0A7W4KDM1_9PROT|nr:hypothetical protein [Gluconacetobacter takamatsuzukensis]MBB2205032.1 hypothetical protein [Gluconacetobacter takamatsuzukensis]